jgi:hypothetical protein
MDIDWRGLWLGSKRWINEDLGLSTNELHIHLGLAVFLALALLLRHRRQGPLVAWCVVAAGQGINEVFDARVWIGWTGTVNWPEAARDTFATLLWPTVLFFVWRVGRSGQG